MTKLATTSRLRILYLSYFSTPAVDRPIYCAIRRHKVRKILELGIADGRRAMRMIEVAGRYCPPEKIEFTGVDPFEGRSSADGPGATLKLAHRVLHRTGARVQLIPGDPFAGLSRCANAIGQVDLIVISSRLDPRSLAKAWFYVPRLLHGQTQIFHERLLPGGRRALEPVGHSDIEAMAAVAAAQRAA